MDFSNKLALYKVMESARVVAIVPSNGIIPATKDVTWLIQGPMESCIYYVPRYLAARAAGFDQRASHERAIEGAIARNGLHVLTVKP